ncbi:CpsD/CapB family tyrosine-protein kinase [Lactobacillus sp. PV037]|uniref:CpsD/CapB family tyrosine-protein kinase n=1 Tax=unclassified Lactobacillus TaxID=2620435 RepID=UPI00223EEF2C|nr:MULTISPECIES: CpsD/CapB family tyrosine-protein kinase [unclassified Lactobacillus]QNQ82772.1 CpsD/CapB family tyrosine-protein kinase [Lactobacillus sp. PV012]QNQ83108.1 CpsD/CapB family tyrosine-protein kinase [Lactobacillus sp. PV037]
MAGFRRNKRGTNETMQHGAKLITVAKPKSPVAEQFRTIRTNINFMSVDEQIKKLAFTSANISEGKSTVTANVAVTMAQSGKKVLLIDADLHRPTLHQTFNIPNKAGLTTILTSESAEINLSDIVKSGVVDNLSVLPSGPIPPNPSELLGSKRMHDFLDNVSNHYDMVIIDMAPVLEISDSQVLAGEMDGVILVVREGVTQKAGIARAVELLKMTKTRILGYIMNDVRTGANGYGYGYGYGYDDKGK